MRQKFNNLTIFQKLIITPTFLLLMFALYLTYTYIEHKKSSEQFREITQKYIPSLELMNSNIVLFEKISTTLKNAIISNEQEWIEHIDLAKQSIENNFDTLLEKSNIHLQIRIESLRTIFLEYIKIAKFISYTMMDDKNNLNSLNDSIKKMETYRSIISTELNNFKEDEEHKLSNVLDKTSRQLNELLNIGIALGIFYIMAVFAISLSTSVKLASYYKKVEELSITDKLTNIFNRTKLDDILEKEFYKSVRYNTPLSIILLDIDFFKKINDTYGHQIGDEVLKEFAYILKDSTRNTDSLGRWGGEEFLIILPLSNLQEAVNLANKLKNKISKFNFSVKKRQTASFGVSSIVKDDTIESILKRADDCLYLAKNRGRDIVVSDNVIT